MQVWSYYHLKEIEIYFSYSKIVKFKSYTPNQITMSNMCTIKCYKLSIKYHLRKSNTISVVYFLLSLGTLRQKWSVENISHVWDSVHICLESRLSIRLNHVARPVIRFILWCCFCIKARALFSEEWLARSWWRLTFPLFLFQIPFV